MGNIAARPLEWVNSLIGAADRCVKEYVKRELELASYTDYYDGSGQRDIILRQFPAWQSQGLLANSMNGVALPQSTIQVVSTQGFHPGLFGNLNSIPPAVAVCTGINSWTYVTYTGTTATSFTGCLGGTGTMSTNPGSAQTQPWSVFSPCVFFDANSYGGQLASSFGPGTQWAPGTQYQLVLDQQGQGAQTPLPLGARASKRGLLRNIGGGGWFYEGGWGYRDYFIGGKLAGSGQPTWPRCDQGIKVIYNAGFLYPPADLSYAVAMLVCQMVRIQPTGANISSESLGGYSYSVLMNEQDPEMGTVRRTLTRYRDPSFASGN